MRRRTLAVLQAAFSTVLASCAQPSPPAAATPEPATPPVLSAASGPTAAPTATGPGPAPMPTLVAPAAPPSAESAAPPFVEGNPNARLPAQLCPGNVVPSLRPGRPVDSLEMRVLREGNQRPEVVVTGRAGSPCGTAKDHVACQRAFDSALPPPNAEILVFTRGDEVGTVARADIPAFLAPIDSPDEAAVAAVYGAAGAVTAVSCDPANYKAAPGGFTSTLRREGRCGHTTFVFSVSKDGKSRLVSNKEVITQSPCHMPVKGRRPEGLAPLPALTEAGDGSLGAHLAEACAFEAASVTSFRRLERELATLGAPRGLRRRARASATDEGRHARLMRRLARRAGVEPSKPRIARIAPRSPLAIALENAVEGCVNETWAALVARYQADHATDAELRETMRIIAKDETRHAALAWDVHAWLAPRLSEDERASVRAAYERALTDLVRAVDDGVGEAERAALGLPTAETAQTMARAWLGAAPTLEGLESGVA